MFYYLFPILCFCVLLFPSCNHDESTTTEEAHLMCYPRVCESIITGHESLEELEKGDRMLPHQKEEYLAKDFLLWMVTSPRGYFAIAKQHLESPPSQHLLWMQHSKDVSSAPASYKLEKALEKDYLHPKTRATSHDGLAFSNLIAWEYRITGVRDFRIEATSTLFGLPAGTSLNRFFRIYEFIPKQIISSRSKSLLWGYGSSTKVETIDKWLSMKPMAPPAIVFRLHEVPQELPKRVKFISILTTDEDQELRDTIEVMLR